MEHVVFYPSFDGTPAFRRVASLEDAARFVEHLRNVEDVTDFSVHALTQVPLSVKPWYRVEVPFEAPGEPVAAEPYGVPAPATAEPVAEPEPEVRAPAAVMPEPVMPEPQLAAAVMPEPQLAAVPEPVEPAAPVEQLEPMTPELAEAVAGGRRSMGFFTR
jgi:hypothetical protein